MNEKKLTAAQVHLLEPLERNFRQATEAAWCSYPGQAAIANMLQVWTELTGQAYAYKPGCPNCLVNLVRDLGTIYFAQKDSVLTEETAAGSSEKPNTQVAKPAQKPATGTGRGKTTSKGRSNAAKLK